jgi:hypothetical protein
LLGGNDWLIIISHLLLSSFFGVIGIKDSVYINLRCNDSQ